MGASNRPTGKNKNTSGGVLLKWRENKQSQAPCYWGDLDAKILMGAVDSVVRAGGAIMLGSTSDGGAYSICILLADDKVKEYPHSVEECEIVLRAVMQEMLDTLL